jgi:hypothetical protein
MGGAVFVNSLKKHNDVDVIINTCKVTAQLAISSDTCADFINCGMTDALVALIKKHKNNEEIVQYASQTLDLIAHHHDCGLKLVQAGLADDILDAVKAYPANCPLEKSTIGLIAKMARVDEPACERLKKNGAVDAIIGALDFHNENEELLAIGAEALRSLAGEEDMLDVLKIKTGNNLITANAMNKMAALCLVEENVEYMIHNQGIEWILNALRSALGDHSPTAAKIMASGCRALARVCLKEENVYALMQKGGVKVLCDIMGEHKKDETISSAAITTLAKCVTRKENAAFVAKSGAVIKAVDVYDANPKSEKVAKACLDFFQRMAMYDQQVPGLMECGVMEATVGMMKDNSENGDVIHAAIHTLSYLCTGEANINKMADAGCLDVLVDAVNNHMDDLELTKEVMKLMETAAIVTENRDALRSMDAVDSILKALECHPDDVRTPHYANTMPTKMTHYYK